MSKRKIALGVGLLLLQFFLFYCIEAAMFS